MSRGNTTREVSLHCRFYILCHTILTARGGHASRTDDSEHDGTNKNTTMPAMGLASKYYTVSLQPSKLVHVLTTSYENKYSCQMARVVMPEEGSLPSELKEDS